MTGIPSYPECAHIKKAIPTLIVNEEIARDIGFGFRVLPIFEKSLYEHNYKKYYSLGKNEYLKCRWQSYVKNSESREFTPFWFIDIRDYHFYNCLNRLIPSESIHTKNDFRHKLKVGPGVDFRGQMPIPQDLLMKRGTQKPKAKGKRYSHPEKEGKENIEEKQLKTNN